VGLIERHPATVAENGSVFEPDLPVAVTNEVELTLIPKSPAMMQSHKLRFRGGLSSARRRSRALCADSDRGGSQRASFSPPRRPRLGERGRIHGRPDAMQRRRLLPLKPRLPQQSPRRSRREAAATASASDVARTTRPRTRASAAGSPGTRVTSIPATVEGLHALLFGSVRCVARSSGEQKRAATAPRSRCTRTRSTSIRPAARARRRRSRARRSG
jgi:hypothetical protein